jgi:hypothetical protein
MKFILKLSFLLFLVLIVSSCSYNRFEKSVIKGINLYSTLEENERFIKEIFYNYNPKSLEKELSITDTTILSKIEINPINDGKSVSLEITFHNEAIQYKEKIKEYLTELVNAKIEQYKYNAYFLGQAEQRSEFVFKMINQGRYDVIWNEMSSKHLRWRNTEQEFYNGLDDIKSNMNLSLKRKLTERVILDKVEGVENTLVSLHYLYEDGNYLEMILEDAADNIKLVALGGNSKNK